MSEATDVVDVIQREYTRLSTKKLEADAAVSAQQRAVLLNESYKKRFSKYIEIVMVISIGLIVYLGVTALQKNMAILPDWIFDVLSGLFFGGLDIYCILIVQDIWTRSVINFDELDLPPYVVPTARAGMTTLDDARKTDSNPGPSPKSEPSPIFGSVPSGSDTKFAGVGLKDAFVMITK
jgi:hypothetical protein